MKRVDETLHRMARERLSQMVSAATYGCVLVLAALSVLGVSEVARGYGAQLVAGVGLAIWVAHLFAEILGGHVPYGEPLRRSDVTRAMVDGSPTFASTVLPAAVLMLGGLGLIAVGAALTISILVAVLQLLLIGALVGRVAAVRPAARWTFAPVTVGVGVAVVALTVSLGH